MSTGLPRMASDDWLTRWTGRAPPDVVWWLASTMNGTCSSKRSLMTGFLDERDVGERRVVPGWWCPLVDGLATWTITLVSIPALRCQSNSSLGYVRMRRRLEVLWREGRMARQTRRRLVRVVEDGRLVNPPICGYGEPIWSRLVDGQQRKVLDLM